MQLSNLIFGCHGISEGCFKFRGKHLPFCARCTGAAVGHISSTTMFFIADLPSVYCAPIGFIIMGADWTLQNKFKLYHSNIARLFTGIAGGFSVGMVIWKFKACIIR